MNDRLLLGWLAKMRPVVQRRRRADMQRHFRTSDVLQEAAIQLLSEFEGTAQPECEDVSQAWLTCVARGHASRLAAWHQRKKRSSSATTSLNHECASPLPSPAETVERNDLWAKAAVILMNLPPTERDIIHRHDINGDSFRLIGESLGKPEHQIKRLYHRAMKKVRTTMAQD